MTNDIINNMRVLENPIKYRRTVLLEVSNDTKMPNILNLKESTHPFLEENDEGAVTICRLLHKESGRKFEVWYDFNPFCKGVTRIEATSKSGKPIEFWKSKMTKEILDGSFKNFLKAIDDRDQTLTHLDYWI